MGEFSLTHILVFAVIFMLFFGPSRIEGIGKSLGRAIRGFKDGINEIETDAKPVAETRTETRKEQLSPGANGTGAASGATTQTTTTTTKETHQS